MTALYLKTATEGEMISALSGAGLLSADPLNPEIQFIRQDEAVMVEVLGPLNKPTGTIISDPEAGDYEEVERLAGFHANVLTDDPAIIAALASIRVYPSTPLVEFAGVNG